MGWRGPEPETRPELLGAGGVGLQRRVGARRVGAAGGAGLPVAGGAGAGPGWDLRGGFWSRVFGPLGLARRTLAERLRRDRSEPGSTALGGGTWYTKLKLKVSL